MNFCLNTLRVRLNANVGKMLAVFFKIISGISTITVYLAFRQNFIIIATKQNYTFKVQV